MAYVIDEYFENVSSSNDYWRSIITRDNLEFGVLFLKKGMKDNQKPHLSDEIYYFIEGDGIFTIGDMNIPIRAGLAIFVPRLTQHYIHSHSQDVKAIYFLN
ncbi:MAG: cupin domain-containing protein [Candidatus Heimdallarchaeota archaeon]|nr:cupin domain-containing protein [Candidatus Heimdallarchaeota archaeon]